MTEYKIELSFWHLDMNNYELNLIKIDVCISYLPSVLLYKI